MMVKFFKNKHHPFGTLLGKGTELTGDLYFEGGIYINGFIKGNVFC